MNPCVSIVVIAYNSERYILETLESAKNQTYQNIELIISDDGSTDETVFICEEWLANNKERFTSTGIITVKKNTGIPANCNRGVKASSGEWVKIIAGDDILHERCIELNVEFVRKSGFPPIIVISNMIRFTNKNTAGTLVLPNNILVLKEGIKSTQQHKYLIKQFIGNTASFFISKKILLNVDFDERFPFNEDYPFALNATKKGYLFKYLDATTVYYRISDNSVFASKSSKVIFNDFYLKTRPFIVQYIYPEISLFERFGLSLEFHRKRIFDKLGINRTNFFCRIANSVTIRLNPYYVFKRIQLFLLKKFLFTLKSVF